MFEEFQPKKRIGYLYPRHIVDVLAYELFKLLPEGVMMVSCPMSLKGFTPEAVAQALAPLDQYVARLIDREVDIIVHGGVPLDVIQGLEQHDARLDRIRKATELPVTSTILTIIAAAKFLGIKNLALANKWTPEMNSALGKFFEREGIRVIGGSQRTIAMQDFLKLKGAAHTNLIYELARSALGENPDADGLYIGGGSMLTFPIIAPLEKEFKKPVITTTNALSWGLCQRLDCWTPVPGYGRLLESR